MKRPHPLIVVALIGLGIDALAVYGAWTLIRPILSTTGTDADSRTDAAP